MDPNRINHLLELHQSPRFKRLDQFERYVAGTQYEGRRSFFDDSYALLDRAPCIVYPLVQSAIGSLIDFVLGEPRWPTISSFSSEDDSDFDDRFGLSEDDSDLLDKFLVKLVDHGRLKSVFRELLAQALGCGTAVPIVAIQGGRVSVSSVRAKWCTPTFAPGTNDLTALAIQYCYVESYKDEHGKWKKRVMAYRRVIDEVSDTVYQPVEVTDGREPEFGAIDEKVEHGFGFCPVFWYRFRSTCDTVADIDGHPIHESLLDELDSLNFSLSQKYRASLYAGDPQICEFAVSKNRPVGEMGPRAMVIMSKDGTPAYLADASPVRSGGMARKKGIGQVWTYDLAESRVEMLTLPGDALKSIDDHCIDLRAKLTEALGVVFIDPEKLPSHSLSGTALEMLYGREIARCDIIREDFGNGCMLPLLGMIMRCLLAIGKENAAALWVPGVSKALPLLQQFEQIVGEDEATAQSQWFCPHLNLVWPEYFRNGQQENLFQIQMTTSAIQAGLITKKMAIESLRDIFPFESADEVLEAVEQEAKEKADQAVEQAKAMAQVQGPPQAFGKPAAKSPPPNGAS